MKSPSLPFCLCLKPIDKYSRSGSYERTGQESTPSYYQIDLKFNYALQLSDKIGLDFFLDVYNVTNNQAPFDLQYGHNDPSWALGETTEILLPTRFYLGARIRF